MELNDDKPRVILTEYKVTQNLPSGPTSLSEQFDIKNFKKKFNIVIVSNENYEMEFDLIGIHPFLANTFQDLY
ncbi:hypothetical protein NQ317_001348 [Molorchus minor]|uniref:Uncharacterized protein n=1 Tax=Molorchus minor TaxID=1323400 RepID=A0ABQ9JN15_9CUCU|nr:hypothetical protein NQ317_001348 [Molorchus minor]